MRCFINAPRRMSTRLTASSISSAPSVRGVPSARLCNSQIPGLAGPVPTSQTLFNYLRYNLSTYESNTGAYAAMPLLLNSPTTDLVSDLLLMKNNASASLSRYT